MPLNADLYLDRIDLAKYAEAESCQVCRVDSRGELVERLRAGEMCSGRCPHWPPQRVEAFRLAVDAGDWLPAIPSLQVPRPTEPGWFDFNGANGASPVLMTGNSRLTHDVLLAVMSTTSMPLWMASVDTGGHTVDMSLVFRTLSVDTVLAAFQADPLPEPRRPERIVLPGLAETLAPELSSRLGLSVEVGPVCGAELPLFFGPAWM